MAKKKSAPAPVELNIGDVDAVFDGWAKDQRSKGEGPAVLTGGESAARCVGIYLPHLILRYFLQSNVLPLGRMMQIAGVQMSGKSTFLYWLYRLFRLNAGRGYHIENETKDAEPRRLAVLDYDLKAVNTIISEALEDWQEAIVWLLSERGNEKKGMSLKEQLTMSGLAGKVPVIMGVDSFTAKSNRANINKIMEEGHAEQDRSQQDNAQSISKWLKVIPQQFGEWPFFLAGTNHLKPGTEKVNAFITKNVENVGGGMALKFQETFQIHMGVARTIDKVEEVGKRYKLRTEKNSIGEDDKVIEVDVVSWIDREPTSPFYAKQRTQFRWDTASIELILGKNSHEFDKKKSILKDLQDVTGIRDCSNSTCYSKKLDVPSNDPVSYADMGARLERGPVEMMKEVHMILSVHEHRVFIPGVQFQAQLAAAQAEAPLPDVVPEEVVDAPAA